MRLKLVRVEGYKRFAQPSALDMRGRVIAIVGPNEAGKTSLLRAMTHISTLTAFDINELTDRDVRAADSRVIEAHFSLEDGDRDLLGTLVPAGTDLTYTRVVYVNGDARYRLSPAIQRDRALRTRAGKALATAVEKGWLAALDDARESEDDTATLVDRARALETRLASTDDRLASDVTEELGALATAIEARLSESSLKSLRTLVDALRTTATFEREPPPSQRINDVLEDRVPEFLLFSDADRDLHSGPPSRLDSHAAPWSTWQVAKSLLEAQEAPAERRADGPSPASAVALPDRVLALQRAAGNAAVGHMLAGRPSAARRLQRCGASCHCDRCGGDEDELADARANLRSAVMARQSERRVARWDWPWERPSPPPPGQPDSGPTDAGPTQGDGGLAPDNPSVEQDPGTPIGVCGPDVTKQVRDTLSKIEKDYEGWPRADKKQACVRILNPISLDKLRTQGLAGGDYNGWDTYGLFSGYADWLRRRPVCPPCATPSSTAPAGALAGDKGHENPKTCSNTVQVGNGCWLAGTVNYATFGMMVRLCGTFSGDPDVGGDSQLEHAKGLIRGYKMFVSKEDPKWPLEWTEAVWRGGAGAITSVGNGNRQGCSTTCGQQNPKANPGALVSWDYVWEPVRPRVANAKPAAPAASGSAAPPAP